MTCCNEVLRGGGVAALAVAGAIKLKKHSKDKTRVQTISRTLKRIPAAVRQKAYDARNPGGPSSHREVKWLVRGLRRSGAPGLLGKNGNPLSKF